MAKKLKKKVLKTGKATRAEAKVVAKEEAKARPCEAVSCGEQTYVKTLLLRRESEQNLFVTHLDDLTEEELQTVFVNFGEVESVVVKELEHRVGYLARDGIEAKTAFALVRFAEPSALEACLAKAAETFPLLTPHIKRASDDLVKEARRRLQLLFYPDPDKLQHMYNGFMKRFEADQAAAEAEKKRRTLEPDEDGFVLVGSKNGFKPTAEDEGASTGAGRGAAGHAGGLSSLLNQADAGSAVGAGGKKKKKKKVLENFYNFQVKDKRQQEMKLEEQALEREKGKGVWFEGCVGARA
eukprot:g11859.t1